MNDARFGYCAGRAERIGAQCSNQALQVVFALHLAQLLGREIEALRDAEAFGLGEKLSNIGDAARQQPFFEAT